MKKTEIIMMRGKLHEKREEERLKGKVGKRKGLVRLTPRKKLSDLHPQPPDTSHPRQEMR